MLFIHIHDVPEYTGLTLRDNRQLNIVFYDISLTLMSFSACYTGYHYPENFFQQRKDKIKIK
ncbi:hypothetical protein BN1221_04845c [Brenneria goodwinii]|uniref:Uncharacterized protein n=1 Tax=Brenneria goodwinii TaxID=1109412 RepID=A0A0G4K2H6_9GAMM|nr:hypothetical protein BN1221_04845c [Brenneria goodwinii]